MASRERNITPERIVENPYDELSPEEMVSLFSDIRLVGEKVVMVGKRVEETKTSSGLYLPPKQKLSNEPEKERPHDPVPPELLFVFNKSDDVDNISLKDWVTTVPPHILQSQITNVYSRRGYQVIIIPSFCVVGVVNKELWEEMYTDPMAKEDLLKITQDNNKDGLA